MLDKDLLEALKTVNSSHLVYWFDKTTGKGNLTYGEDLEDNMVLILKDFIKKMGDALDNPV